MKDSRVTFKGKTSLGGRSIRGRGRRGREKRKRAKEQELGAFPSLHSPSPLFRPLPLRSRKRRLRSTEAGSEESERFHFLPTRSVYDSVADCRSGKQKRKDNPITLTFPRFVIDWFSSSDSDDPVFT